MKLALIFAEFNRQRPDVNHFLHYFPEAEAQVFTDADVPNVFADHPRWGWRMNDYWKVRKALDGGADVAISFDADMRIVSPQVRTLLDLVKAFGLCLPANPRLLVSVDTGIGADSDHELDETQGTGHAVNCSPIAINLHHKQARATAEEYCRIMLERPVRGPLAWWRAMKAAGFCGHLLPFQWCVCAEHVGIGNEIILHEGHEAVRRHYGVRSAS